MIESKDIINHVGLPNMIKNHAVFRDKDSYEKVFPLLGLSNFRTPLKCLDKKSKIPFILKHSLWGAKINFPVYNNDLVTQAIWKIIGASSFLIDLTYSCLKNNRFIKNYDSNNINIVFSSDNIDGAWDIATMSMRGISSCQSWANKLASSLIGSIVDPCCGVIYIEDIRNKNKYGSTMLYRSVVRFTIHDKIGPCLFLEKVYENNNNTYLLDAETLFASTLHKLTGLPVIYSFCIASNEYKTYMVIPHSTVIRGNMSIASYRDSQLQYISSDLSDLTKLKNSDQIKKLLITFPS